MKIEVRRGIEIEVGVKWPLDGRDGLSPEQRAAILEGIAKVVSAVNEKEVAA